MAQKLFAIGSLFGFLSVALGAFGAHALKAKLTPYLLDIFETGVKYQFYHALAILAVALAVGQWKISPTPAYFFIAGIIIFSGSLFLLAFTGIKTFGAITPIGGVMFLIGWSLLAYQTFKNI